MKLTIPFLVILIRVAPRPLSSARADEITIPSQTVPFPIQIILVGFHPHPIDQDYLTWKGNIVQGWISNMLSSENITGVVATSLVSLILGIVIGLGLSFITSSKFAPEIVQGKPREG